MSVAELCQFHGSNSRFSFLDFFCTYRSCPSTMLEEDSATQPIPIRFQRSQLYKVPEIPENTYGLLRRRFTFRFPIAIFPSFIAHSLSQTSRALGPRHEMRIPKGGPEKGKPRPTSPASKKEDRKIARKGNEKT